MGRDSRSRSRGARRQTRSRGRRRDSRDRRRSRSPRRRSFGRHDSRSRGGNGQYSNNAPEEKKEWNLKFAETREDGPNLDRHRDATRSTKPAWMTKGVGVGEDMFGKPKGIIKPGDNPDGPAEAAPKFPDYDPMGDVFRDNVKDLAPDEPASAPESSNPEPTYSSGASEAQPTTSKFSTEPPAAPMGMPAMPQMPFHQPEAPQGMPPMPNAQLQTEAPPQGMPEVPPMPAY